MRKSIGRWIVPLEELLFGYAVYVFVFRFLPGVHFSRYSSLHIVLGSVFSGLFILCQACFARVSLSSPGHTSETVMKKYVHNGEKSIESFMTERKQNGEMRSCNKCKNPKPDRAHHCSICNKCILKMDHHCPFVNNCVGFRNYKFFLIFIFWTLCFCCFVTACMIYDNYNLFTKHHKKLDYFEIAAGFICVLVTFLLLILFSNHIKFVAFNLTTIEYVEKKVVPTRHPYNLGAGRNFVEIFGNNPFLWLLPVWTSRGDGVTFHVQHETSSLLTHT